MQKKNTVKIMVNFRFIGLLTIAFLLQHFSFAGLQNNFGFNHLNAGIVQNNYFEKGSPNQQGSALEIFAEVADEDEDEVHNEQDFYQVTNSSNQSSNAQHYSNAINTLYLSLASSNQHKVDVPFFILFHSWKSYLA
ncbi:MAG: hypothetical protein EBU05_03530 [Chitinophagia bacterium]|jgi:hypothetical protein|nr:hypothetical protein [Chitinophagia bacterium]